jgi:hypothetical protein
MIGILYDSDGNTVISAKDFGNIIAGNDPAKKIFIQNNSATRETGQITGSFIQYGAHILHTLLQWAFCQDTLSCPFNVAATVEAGGSLTAETTYFYRITAYNANGETTGSIEVFGTTTAANKQIRLSWSEIAGAAGYLIYRSEVSRSYSSARRAVIENPATVEWLDNGQSASPSGPYSFPGINTDFDLPSENTTAGEGPDYGTAPTLTTSDLAIGVLGIGEMKAIWLGIDTEVSTPSGATAATINFQEV